MAETGRNSDKTTDESLLDLTFNPSDTTEAPSLRQPNLSEAQLQAALTFGFSGKFLPSSVTGGGGGQAHSNISVSDRSSNNRVSQSASMINNHSNYNSNQTTGSQNQYPLFVDNYCYNLTEEEQAGLLPALRRPDVNTLPPDVLALVLKSPRFQEILIPNQRRFTTEPPPNHNYNAQPQSQQQFRQPPQESYPPNNLQQQSMRYNKSVAESDKFSLSPFAKEFVPTSYQSPSSMNSQERQDLAYAMSQINVQNQNDSFSNYLADESDGSDCVLSTVTDMISQVSQDPASLNRCARNAVNVLKKHLKDDEVLGVVVTLLVEQIISNTNFCYSGAKILDILRENNIGVGKNAIKQLVLTRMHEEFNNCLNNLDDPDVRIRSHGVLRLLSELYMNFNVVSGTKLNILGLAVLELMEELIKADKSLESVKCVCQLLKLVGWELENSDAEKVREYFGKVMNELNRVRTAGVNINPTCQILVENIFKLQSNKWNREQEDPTPTTSNAAVPGPYFSSDATFYDEVPESDDDSFGEDGAIMIDDEPDEVQAAYEEFLKMSSKK